MVQPLPERSFAGRRDLPQCASHEPKARLEDKRLKARTSGADQVPVRQPTQMRRQKWEIIARTVPAESLCRSPDLRFLDTASRPSTATEPAFGTASVWKYSLTRIPNWSAWPPALILSIFFVSNHCCQVNDWQDLTRLLPRLLGHNADICGLSLDMRNASLPGPVVRLMASDVAACRRYRWRPMSPYS